MKLKKNKAVYMMAYFIVGAFLLNLSINWSRDYESYLEIILTNESTDVLFDAFIEFGQQLGLGPEGIYNLYFLCAWSIFSYYCYSRKISFYWIVVYFLNFGLLHLVTQVRVGMASFVVALLLTSARPLIRFFMPLSTSIHASAIVYVAGLINYKNVISNVVAGIIPLALVIVSLNFNNERILRYENEANETQLISISFLVYIYLLFVVALSKVERQIKSLMIGVGISTIVIYWLFIDFKAVSNRFVEMSSAVTILLLAANDLNNGRSVPPLVLKFSHLVVSVIVFYFSNIKNSILNF